MMSEEKKPIGPVGLFCVIVMALAANELLGTVAEAIVAAIKGGAVGHQENQIVVRGAQ